jgi:hypothetical protein
MNTNLNSCEKAMERTAVQVLADEFLVARAKVLELAATLDRIERASGEIDDSKQMILLLQGLQILCDQEIDKAKRVQLLMSRQYDPEWRENLSVVKRGS